MALNEAKLGEFMNKIVGDLGATIGAAMIIIGDKVGLYKAMAGAGPLTPSELSKKAGTAERYTREWLLNQAAGGYVEYDKKTGTFLLPDEHAAALADEESPMFATGGFQVIQSVFQDASKIAEAFQSGKGIPWGDHSECLFCGTARFFKSTYTGNLVNNWIPALDGVEARLRSGATVADIGCGFGLSTIIMAKAYPKSKFFGFDNHEPSVRAAREEAEKAGVADRVQFATASSTDFPGKDYDVACCFDCLHDMGDPVGCATHVKKVLKPDGVWMIVEPFANDRPEDNLNPVGRVFYGASTAVCVPASLAFGGPALGAQAGESKLREVVEKGGFKRFRRATETPFNLILEARP